MNERHIRRIVIVGGGTAGWMAAAPLSQQLPREGPMACEIVLVESPDIATVGVGEATIPPIRAFNSLLGLDDTEFTKRTQGTYKLGIEFRNWGRIGHRFFHGFGDFGPQIQNRSPYQHWLRLSAKHPDFPSYEDWSTSSVMARHMKFTPPLAGPRSAHNSYSYAYQFDASLYAGYLREYAMARGVQRELGTVVDVELRPEDGFVAAVRMADGAARRRTRVGVGAPSTDQTFRGRWGGPSQAARDRRVGPAGRGGGRGVRSLSAAGRAVSVRRAIRGGAPAQPLTGSYADALA
jgi:tryptophan halogenase